MKLKIFAFVLCVATIACAKHSKSLKNKSETQPVPESAVTPAVTDPNADPKPTEGTKPVAAPQPRASRTPDPRMPYRATDSLLECKQGFDNYMLYCAVDKFEIAPKQEFQGTFRVAVTIKNCKSLTTGILKIGIKDVAGDYSRAEKFDDGEYILQATGFGPVEFLDFDTDYTNTTYIDFGCSIAAKLVSFEKI